MSDASRQSSPKSSPRGSRSPAYPRTDSTGIPTLKIKIGQGKTPSVVPNESGPFYLFKVKDQNDVSEQPTGSTNLMSYYNLEHSYHKYCGKKLKEELSAFLPHLPGNIDTPGSQDNSSLRSVIEKPPITGKELLPLTPAQLTGFRLHPGPLPEQYRSLFSQSAPQKHKKHKKHKKDSKEGSQENIGAESQSETEAKKKKEKPAKDDAKATVKKEKKKKKKKREKEKDVLLTN